MTTRFSLFSIALACLMVVFVGCQESGVIESNSGAGGDITLDADNLFKIIDEHLASDQEALWLSVNSDAIAELEPNEMGALEGGIQFGQFTGEQSFAIAFAMGLSKEEDPECSVDKDANWKKKAKFGMCVLRHVLACDDGGTVHYDKESNEVHYHDSC